MVRVNVCPEHPDLLRCSHLSHGKPRIEKITKEMLEESAQQLERAAQNLRAGIPVTPGPGMAKRLDRAIKALRAYVPMRDALIVGPGLPEGFEEIWS